MERILIVDDEPNILSGLKRMLFPMHSKWEIQTALNGESALEKMRKVQFNVVVSDMRMPGMNGFELLDKIKELYPDTIRIILSGHSDKDLILKSVNTAHQYLAKPCNSQMLISSIERTLDIRELLKNPKILKIVSSLPNLPSLPELYTDILEEMKKNEPSMKKIAEIIGNDISMSAKVLQLVNSAFFALPRQITSIQNAVTLLGLETISTLVLSIKIFSQFNYSALSFFPVRKLWDHSIRVAKFSEYIIKKYIKDNILENNAFIAGMMHDIGRLILLSSFPKEYKEIIDESGNSLEKVFMLEQQKLKVTHAIVGAYLLSLWGFPYPVIEAVAYHHTPGESKSDNNSPLLFIYLSDIIDNNFQNNSHMSTDTNYLSRNSFGKQIKQVENEYKFFFNERS